MKCAICGAIVPARSENRAWPLCSKRCQQVDLGRWLHEVYAIPIATEAPAVSEEAPGGDDEPPDERH